MTKVKFTARLGEHGYLGDLYTVSNLELTTDSSRKAVYEDSANANKIVLIGKGFTYDGDEMTGGTIRSIVFADEDNKRFATVLDGKWDPQELLTAYFVDGFEGMTEFVLKGRDRMKGSNISDTLHAEAGADKVIGGKGDDRIFGDTGNDRLTGSKGSDTFFFYPGDGNDVITDFDASGGGTKQDYLGIEPLHTFEEVLTKRGLRLDFESGDSLLLLGVKKIDEGDFAIFN
jgi:Ca2+-binding RTX toxin-like protein